MKKKIINTPWGKAEVIMTMTKDIDRLLVKLYMEKERYKHLTNLYRN